MSRGVIALGSSLAASRVRAERKPVGGRAPSSGDRPSPLAPDVASQLVRTMWERQGKFVTADADGVRVAGEATS